MPEAPLVPAARDALDVSAVLAVMLLGLIFIFLAGVYLGWDLSARYHNPEGNQ